MIHLVKEFCQSRILGMTVYSVNSVTVNAPTIDSAVEIANTMLKEIPKDEVIKIEIEAVIHKTKPKRS